MVQRDQDSKRENTEAPAVHDPGVFNELYMPTIEPSPRYVVSPYLVPFDGDFNLEDFPTGPPGKVAKKKLKEELREVVAEIAELQHRLYADDRYAILPVFQAMDAAGKDGTIRHVFTGVNPAGIKVHSLKVPSANELQHDFLWRTNQLLPQRGMIGILNRSYYEEVLVVRVHPEFLHGQGIPELVPGDDLWAQRFRSIVDLERHLALNGTIPIKFWLNVSKEEQARRFLARIDEPEKNWKFSDADIAERQHWDAYMHAYGETLRHTSTPWAPWYAIPADNKHFMRLTVARIIRDTLRALDIEFPAVSKERRKELKAMRGRIASELK